MRKRRKFLLFPLYKAHPDQAGSIRRFAAFACDGVIIVLLSVCIYSVYSEISALEKGEKGIVSQVVAAIKKGNSIIVTDRRGHAEERALKRVYLLTLKKYLSREEYRRAEEMSLEEMKEAYPEEMAEGRKELTIIQLDERFSILHEFIIGYVYFALFFHFGGCTLGKRLLRLQVIDLKGRRRLGWYQSFERAHGYAASALFASLGFLQVLWDAEGLTMHDKIAGTTVVKLPRKSKGRPHR